MGGPGTPSPPRRVPAQAGDQLEDVVLGGVAEVLDPAPLRRAAPEVVVDRVWGHLGAALDRDAVLAGIGDLLLAAHLPGAHRRDRLQLRREEEIAYAREHGIPVKGGAEVTPYSIDDNLWGRSSEGRWIEDLGHAPEDDVFQLVTRPELAPDEAETVTVEFEAGVPVALNGERLGLVELLEATAEVGCRHGVGIVDQIEDRIVGLKVRDIYEAPAAAILLPAHRELEKLVGTIHQNQFKPGLDQKWGY